MDVARHGPAARHAPRTPRPAPRDALAADQRRGRAGRRWVARALGMSPRARAQPAEHLRARGPRLGVAAEQVDAQGVEVLRHARGPARAGRAARSAACPSALRAAARGTAAGRSGPRRASPRRCTSRSPARRAGRRPARGPCRPTVPRMCGSELWCSPAGSSSAARPKSRSTTRPRRVTSTLDGLMSRWSLPASCRATTPSASCPRASRRRLNWDGDRPEGLSQAEHAARPPWLRIGQHEVGDDVLNPRYSAPRAPCPDAERSVSVSASVARCRTRT